MESFTLRNGAQIPALGYGVFEMTGDEVRQHLPQAIDAGIRHIDTANAYFNEIAVGEVVRNSSIDRSEFFITSKLWPRDYGYEDCKKAIDATLRRLNMDYVDLLLLHQPYGNYTEAWKALEEAQAEGKVRSIGLSNFNRSKFQEVLDMATVVPEVLQVELHPYWNQHEMRAWLEPMGVRFEAWYPLGHGDPALLQEPVLTQLAEKYGKTPAQVILRWDFQNGVVTFPKSLNPEHMRQNMDIFDFELSDDEMAAINGLEKDAPYYVVPEEAPAFIAATPDFDQQQ